MKPKPGPGPASERRDGEVWVRRTRRSERLLWNCWRMPFPRLLERWDVRIAQRSWHETECAPDHSGCGPVQEGWGGFSSFFLRTAENWVREYDSITDEELLAWEQTQYGDPREFIQNLRKARGMLPGSAVTHRLAAGFRLHPGSNPVPSGTLAGDIIQITAPGLKKVYDTQGNNYEKKGDYWISAGPTLPLRAGIDCITIVREDHDEDSG